MVHWYLVALVAIPLIRVNAWTVGQAVKTTSGVYTGHASKSKPEVSEYLGMRFGQETSGERRFARPVKFSSTEAFNAEKFSDDCPGVLTNATGALARTGSMILQQKGKASENCLTINVWTKPQTGDKAKAVMLWMYGGGFNIGTSNTPLYDGSKFAGEQDVVLVTFNYRLAIFGFPGGPEGLDNNLAFLDQRLATEWVRDNIAAFGGDPKRITIFGESAGAGSVDMYAYAWADKDVDPIIAGIIPESGSASANRGGPLNMGTKKAWWDATKKLGCGGETAGMQSVECMRKKSWLDVINANRGDGLRGGFMSAFGPAADGKLVFNDYQQRNKEGKFIKVPLLIGNNDNESGFFAMMNPRTKQDPATAKQRNAGFECPSGAAADARRLQGVPSWRYRYMPNKAVHGAEIGSVFALSNVIMQAWATFAKDPQNGLTKLGWPKYNPLGKTLILLGEGNGPGATFGSVAE